MNKINNLINKEKQKKKERKNRYLDKRLKYIFEIRPKKKFEKES